MKNVVAFTGAVVFFTALNVQAYFDPSTGRWANRDPIDEAGFQKTENSALGEVVSGDAGNFNLYAFVNNTPITAYDAEGLLAVRFLSGKDQSCGGWANQWIDEMGNISDSCWFVQKIEISGTIHNCSGSQVPTPPITWWEADMVFPEESQSIDNDDAPNYPSTRGEQFVSGIMRIYPNQSPFSTDIPEWPVVGHMHRTYNPPTWWSNAPDSSEAIRSSWSVWDCCCPSYMPASFGHSP